MSQRVYPGRVVHVERTTDGRLEQITILFAAEDRPSNAVLGTHGDVFVSASPPAENFLDDAIRPGLLYPGAEPPPLQSVPPDPLDDMPQLFPNGRDIVVLTVSGPVVIRSGKAP